MAYMWRVAVCRLAYGAPKVAGEVLAFLGLRSRIAVAHGPWRSPSQARKSSTQYSQHVHRYIAIMPRSRSHSRSESPRRIQPTRSRSRSPRRRTHDDQPRRRDKGFKWKEQRDNINDPRDSTQARGLERGYKSHYRMEQNRTHSPLRRDTAAAEDSKLTSHVTPALDLPEKRDKKEKKKNKGAGPAMPQEPMIIVNVNDRLGTKAAIPCLASDQISRVASS